MGTMRIRIDLTGIGGIADGGDGEGRIGRVRWGVPLAENMDR